MSDTLDFLDGYEAFNPLNQVFNLNTEDMQALNAEYEKF